MSDDALKETEAALDELLLLVHRCEPVLRSGTQHERTRLANEIRRMLINTSLGLHKAERVRTVVDDLVRRGEVEMFISAGERMYRLTATGKARLAKKRVSS